MKGLKTLAVLALAVFALPLFGALNAYLKIDGLKGGSSPGHEGWIELMSFSWGVSNQRPTATGAAAACATNEAKFSVKFLPLSQANPLPGPLQLGLTAMCITHKQSPTMTVDVNGQQHVLQNASIESCQDTTGGKTFTLHFARCATHGGGANAAAMVNPNVHPVGSAKILIGLTPRPEAFDFSSLQFQGSNAAIILQRNAVQGNFFQQAFQSKQTFPSLTIERKAGKGQQEYIKMTMSDVLITSYQVMGDGSVKIGLSFSKVDGSTRGFQEVN